MRATLAVIVLWGVTLYVDAACNSGACTLAQPVTGTAGCVNYQNFINCLNAEKAGCTSSSADQITALSIAGTVTANTVLRAALQCGAAGITVSVFTVLLSALAALLKL